MKTATQIKLRQLIIITVLWLFLGVVITTYDFLVINTQMSLGPSKDFSFLMALFRNTGAGFIGAVLGGSLLVFYVNEKFRDKPYGYTLFIVCGTFILIVILITLIMGIILVPMQTGAPFSNSETKAVFLDFISDTYPLKNALVWIFIVGFTQIMLQINSKFGHRTFWNILRGRYQTPQKEKRIFMFLDLDDSTSIAENLGNEAYHRLLKDFFADITDPIIENKGNIYQYVGDEVVVAWDYAEGLDQQHCLKCFFDIKKVIQQKRMTYLKRYGWIPTFKAGFHSGNVVAGEVGIVKRDITYSGDVLNTTARILSKCSELKEEILVSSDLLALMNNSMAYHSKLLGKVMLKGKHQEISIHTLTHSKP